MYKTQVKFELSNRWTKNPTMLIETYEIDVDKDTGYVEFDACINVNDAKEEMRGHRLAEELMTLEPLTFEQADIIYRRHGFEQMPF